MKFIEESDNYLYAVNKKEYNWIYLFQQFFIHKSEERMKEIRYCLKKNVENESIETIYLLNELDRPYTPEELGCSSPKICQLPMGHRMKYSDIIHFVKIFNMNAYIVIANSDIYFDETLIQLKNVDLINDKKVFCQLRWEYEGDDIPVKIFSYHGLPRHDSQDVWVYHSAHNDLLHKHTRAFQFELGQAGCDNHITYLFKTLGFGIINDPMLIHCIHFHKTQIREYKQENRILPPYMLVNPKGCPLIKYNDTLRFNDNDNIRIYIGEMFDKNMKFIIPRIAGVENNTAYTKKYEYSRPVVMKENAGILLTSQRSVEKYSKTYLKAFQNCQIYTGWEKHGDVYRGISASQDFVENHVAVKAKMYWAFALDIFHYIHSNAWTTALRGKKVLIVSAFCDTISKQIKNKNEIYGVDLFPDCRFEFIKPPQTQGKNPSFEWDIELKLFTDKLDLMRDDYDIALVSSGGYGNLICNYIYEQHNKSAIYVGGVLQMYFGVYGGRWLTERPSVIKMYLNQYWTRPSMEERPDGFQKIESGCYF
tara:strand:+ start:661 stop:2265 length:1605 start_codon:yes stop_codon:yes gene_type:complete